MKLVAPPLYVLTTQTLDKNKGVEVLTAACESCAKSIEKARGKLVVKEAARAVSERDDRLLAEKASSHWHLFPPLTPLFHLAFISPACLLNIVVHCRWRRLRMPTRRLMETWTQMQKGRERRRRGWETLTSQQVLPSLSYKLESSMTV
jgi:hypothetical protein